MGYKDDDARLAKAQPGEPIFAGEPIFVLLGRDKLAPPLIRAWADAAEVYGCAPEKVAEARKCAKAMELWPTRKYPD